MKIGILPVSFLVLVLIENVNACMSSLLLGAPSNRSVIANKSSDKQVATSIPKTGKMISLVTTTAKRSSFTTKKSSAIKAPGKMETTLRARTSTQKMKSTSSGGKTTTKKSANLKDTRRTTKSSKPFSKPSTIRTPFGVMESFQAMPYPTSKGGRQPVQTYNIPGIMYSAPFFPGHATNPKDYENPFDKKDPLDVGNITTLKYENIPTTTISFENVTTTEFGNVTILSPFDNATRAEFPFPLEENAFDHGVTTTDPDMNASLDITTTKKRLKRKKTTVGADLTTRKRLKRKRTTTAAPTGAEDEYKFEEY